MTTMSLSKVFTRDEYDERSLPRRVFGGIGTLFFYAFLLLYAFLSVFPFIWSAILSTRTRSEKLTDPSDAATRAAAAMVASRNGRFLWRSE